MKKLESVLNDRVIFIQKKINDRAPGTKIETVVRELADQLFLSKETIWKDYGKDVKPLK